MNLMFSFILRYMTTLMKDGVITFFHNAYVLPEYIDIGTEGMNADGLSEYCNDERITVAMVNH